MVQFSLSIDDKNNKTKTCKQLFLIQTRSGLTACIAEIPTIRLTKLIGFHSPLQKIHEAALSRLVQEHTFHQDTSHNMQVWGKVGCSSKMTRVLVDPLGACESFLCTWNEV